MTSSELREIKKGGLSKEEVDRLLDETDELMKRRRLASVQPLEGSDYTARVPITSLSYAILLDLLGRVVRNLEYIAANEKEQLIDELIRRWCLIAKNGIGEWDNVVEAFIRFTEITPGKAITELGPT